MSKRLFALPFLGLALIAAKPAEPAPTGPSVNPPAEIAANPDNRLTLELSNGGRVVIQLRPDVAPVHVERYQTLVRSGFYNGVPFHRVIPGFMAQGGDPTGTGQGGSKLPDLKAEFTAIPHLRGTVSAARTDQPDTANSQFFIMFAPSVALDNKYTVFGRVIEGMAAVDTIAPGEPPAQPTRIVRAYLGMTAPAMAAAPVAPPAAAIPAPAAPAEAATAAPAPAAPAAAETSAPAPAAPAETAAPAEGAPAESAPAEPAPAPAAESAPAEPAQAPEAGPAEPAPAPEPAPTPQG